MRRFPAPACAPPPRLPSRPPQSVRFSVVIDTARPTQSYRRARCLPPSRERGFGEKFPEVLCEPARCPRARSWQLAADCTSYACFAVEIYVRPLDRRPVPPRFLTTAGMMVPGCVGRSLGGMPGCGGITPAASQFAVEFEQDRSIDEVAAGTGRSRATVKRHLRHICAEDDLSRQAGRRARWLTIRGLRAEVSGARASRGSTTILRKVLGQPPFHGRATSGAPSCSLGLNARVRRPERTGSRAGRTEQRDHA